MADEVKILKRALEREKLARKQAEKILESKSLELFTLAQKLKDTNEKLEELIDIKRSELQYDKSSEGLNVLKLIYEEDYTYAMASFKALVSNGTFTDYQARVYTKHNGVRTVHINASIIKNNKNTPIGAQGIVREQKKQLAVIVENSSLGIVLTKFGKIIQTNKAFQNLLGHTEEELKNMEVEKVSIKEEYSKVRDHLDKMNEGALHNVAVNKRYIRKDGTQFWAKTNVAPVKDPEGKVIYQVALVEDITEQIEHEKQRDQLLKNLEKSNNELNDFAHIVSHDLKSPLRSINALTTWLKEDYHDVLDDSAQQSFNMLLKKVDKMDHLINGILKYSSIDKIEQFQKDIDLLQVIKDTMDIIFIPDHIKISIETSLPTIKGDKFRLQQLFQNLINNAVKYNDKEQGWIKVACKEQSEFWEFSIEDNGPGIPEKYHQKIFQIFQTLDNGKESTGVGLSIVKKIIDMYEGKIWVTSQNGIGTTFHFTIKKD